MTNESLPPSHFPVLCVDLDGTLIDGDVSVQTFFMMLRVNPLRIFPAIRWFLQGGRARMKREIARRVPLDPATLAYRPSVMAFLQGERAQGRKLVLATASDQIYADVIALHVGIFDETLGSDGLTSLSSHRKRDALLKRYGKYSYMGNSHADLEVWREAEEAIAVATPARVLRQLEGFKKPALIFPQT
ncbi:MAG: haloacid dehalogenase-like hydrolase [Terrimicrobiaceae bacterium]